jgi:hypothetical protein
MSFGERDTASSTNRIAAVQSFWSQYLRTSSCQVEDVTCAPETGQ